MTHTISFLALTGTLAAVLIPIKLSLTYFAIIPGLLWYGYSERTNLKQALHRYPKTIIPALFFVFCILYSSLFGLDTGRSIAKGLSLAGMFLLIPFYALLRERNYMRTILLALTIGFSIESLHTILESAFPNVLFSYPHGQVSEAGQLGIGLFVIIALCIGGEIKQRSSESIMKTLFTGLITFLLLIFLGLSNSLSLSPITTLCLFSLSSFLLIKHCYLLMRLRGTTHVEARLYAFLSEFVLPLVCAALVINMKRGPWIGVTIGLVLLLITIRPRYLLGIIPVIFALLLLQPIRTRLLNSLEHFLMVGGRGEIWQLGGELLVRYPLGIGFQNSRLIEQFSHDIPSNMNHFHSNLINIIVELGWLGIVSYLWWIGAILILSFSKKLPSEFRYLQLALGCGVLSWQIAGLFEYNFGDSEVFIVALIIIGTIIGGTPDKSGKVASAHST